MKRVILAIVLTIGLAAPAHAGFDEGLAAYKRNEYAVAEQAQQAVTPEMRALIVKLMKMTGAIDIGVQLADAVLVQMKPVFKNQNPNIPERAFDIMQEEFRATFLENRAELTEQIVIIYNRHFTASELRKLIVFYQTPIGRKTISIIPRVFQESTVAGQQFSQRMMPVAMQRVQQRFKEEGINAQGRYGEAKKLAGSRGGTEEILRRVIADIRKSKTDFEYMEPGLVTIVRPQLNQTTRSLQELGGVKLIDRNGTEAGMDVYRVIFENGEQTWKIGLSARGRIRALFYHH